MAGIQKKLMPTDFWSQRRRRLAAGVYPEVGFDACFSGPIGV
jgi:hypothetical protein